MDIEGLKKLAMEQHFEKFFMFRNRLEKVFRHIGKQARRQQISCYRLYDHDIPEFPFIIEFYEENIYVSEYKRQHGLEENEHEQWLATCIKIMVDVLSVKPENVFLKVRQRKMGRQGQYQKLTNEKSEFIVQENGLKFIINLSDYLDTGLFLDHRITRKMIMDTSYGKKVLNLFCYTGSFSVYALAGGGSEVISVDLSKTYLEWAVRNMELNFKGQTNHKEIHADVLTFIKECKETYDLIILDPPTFSNSKRMEDFFDIQKHHADIINDCINLLGRGGVLFFSTNYTRFQMDRSQILANEIKDITKATIPFDFSGKLKRQCFRITKSSGDDHK